MASLIFLADVALFFLSRSATSPVASATFLERYALSLVEF